MIKPWQSQIWTPDTIDGVIQRRRDSELSCKVNSGKILGKESETTSKELDHAPKNALVSIADSHDSLLESLSGDWHFESDPAPRTASPIDKLVGCSRVMMNLRARIIRYAETEETVLISGETGTGKELIATLLHELSPRRSAPFVAINCAAIPGSLAESELFGNARGAYTGAVNCRSGLLSRADGGTLFLDELGELPIEVQSKLLRALEIGSYLPLGAIREERVNFRVVAATNRNLEKSVRRGEFRSDLYYRINVLQIIAPPLRDHKRDIPLIAGAILAKLLPSGSKVRVTDEVMASLIQAPWLGNVRELTNVLRRSLVISRKGVIDQLEPWPDFPEADLETIRSQLKHTAQLTDSLARHKGRLEAVAREFRVSVRTVQRRVKASGLRARDFRSI